MNDSMKEPNKFHNYKTEKISHKAVTRQNISSCLVLPPEIVMHDAFNDILWTSADICVVVHHVRPRRLVIFYLKCAAYKSTYLLTYLRPRVEEPNNSI